MPVPAPVHAVLAYFIAAMSPNMDVANALLPLYVSTMLYFSGFLITYVLSTVNIQRVGLPNQALVGLRSRTAPVTHTSIVSVSACMSGLGPRWAALYWAEHGLATHLNHRAGRGLLPVTVFIV